MSRLSRSALAAAVVVFTAAFGASAALAGCALGYVYTHGKCVLKLCPPDTYLNPQRQCVPPPPPHH